MSEGGYNHAKWYRPCPGLPYGILTNLLLAAIFIVVYPIVLVVFPLFAAFPIAGGLAWSCVMSNRYRPTFLQKILIFILFIIFLPFTLLGAGIVICGLLILVLVPGWLATLLFMFQLIWNTIANFLS